MISVSGLAALSTIGTILKEARVVNDLRNRLEVPGAESPALPELNSFDALPPRRLFLVEDHVDALRAFTRVLRREGFEVQEASNVSKAIAVTRPGDFLLSDI